MARESWTDERLDEFGKRIDERFDRVDEKFAEADKRIDAVRSEMKEGFEQVDKRLERLADGVETLGRAMIFGAIAMSSAIIAGFGALATQV